MKLMAMKRYELLADLYTEVTEQDPDTGTINKHWDYENPNTIKVKAWSERPWGSVEKFGAQYEDQEYVALQTPTFCRLAQRIGRIRNKNGETLWRNDNGRPTVFNIEGCSPNIDPMGRLVDYTVLLELVETQPL